MLLSSPSRTDIDKLLHGDEWIAAPQNTGATPLCHLSQERQLSLIDPALRQHRRCL
jgi:hypothetical protein